MGSIELVEDVIRLRDKDYSKNDGSARVAIAELARYGILNNRQIASALGISHTIVNRYNKPVKGQQGAINWDSAPLMLRWLRGDQSLSMETLESYGTRRKVLEWLWANI